MPRIPEKHKTPGLCYAYTVDGLELPVIDVAHPAFEVAFSDAELAAQARAFMAEQARGQSSWLGRLFVRHVLPRLLGRSRLGRGLARARNGYLDGISTYLLKLGPAQLGQGYADAMDRRIAASFPALGTRLRLQDTATLMAEALAPALRSAPGQPLHLVNIAGGPSMDSLNALMLLRRDPAQPLLGRPVRIQVLDLEADGAAFASAALAALLEPGAPLYGLDVALSHRPYDWNDAAALDRALDSLPPTALLAVSSEGGLWNYAPDAVVLSHFQALARRAPQGTTFTGSISEADGAGQAVKLGSLARLELRNLDAFTALAAAQGWRRLASRQRLANAVLCLRLA
ncbi:MAG TPA: hypothetical protein VNZ54_04305 [bacterium]|nr:hypothetical protein [bacterium]